MTVDLKSATTALREGLPRQAKWMLKGVPLVFDFTRAQDSLCAVDADELGGDPDAEWIELLVFGEQDYASGGGSCPLLAVDRRDGSVCGFDPEREPSVFLLNSSVDAFIEVFTHFDEYFRNNAPISADVVLRVKRADPSVYESSEWRLFAEYLVPA